MRWLLLASLLSVGCVPAAPVRPSPSEAAEGPPAPLGEATAVRELTERRGARSVGSAESPQPAEEVQRRISGYWHWNGVRYVWIAGRKEPERQPWQRE